MELEKQKELIILSLLRRILGPPKIDKEGLKEVEYNCPRPTCKHDSNKYNLSFNVETNLFHCWRCKYKGSIHKIVEDYGTSDEKERINLLIPRASRKNIQKEEIIQEQNTTCKLPYGFKKLCFKNKTELYQKAIEYLDGRLVDKKKIEKHNIGYVEEGYYSGRIIVPSYNSNYELNYYVGRAFIPGVVPNYLGISNKVLPKDNVIFNESNVNFDLPVYLVEGVFDMFPIYNVVPILGKVPSVALVKKLLEHKSTIIICLDEDAIKDSIELYEKFISYGLDVYFVEIKQDISQYHVEHGKEKLIEMIKGYRKLDLKYILQLKMKEQKQDSFKIEETVFSEEWKKLKLIFENK